MFTYEVKPSLWINNMNHCKKYFCACQCIYDLLGMSHMNTTYKHMYPQHPHPQQTRNNPYHTISSHGIGLLKILYGPDDDVHPEVRFGNARHTQHREAFQHSHHAAPKLLYWSCLPIDTP